MAVARIFAVILIAGGVFALVNHRFSYTRESHAAKIVCSSCR